MIFRCRAIKPKQTLWSTIGEETVEDAVATFQCLCDPPFVEFVIDRGGGATERLRVVAVEVEGHGVFFSRMFESGIWRKGGVQPPVGSLVEKARALGWTGDPKELVEDGWPGEEPYKNG